MVPIVIGALGTIPQRFGMGTRELGSQRTSPANREYSITKVGQNTEKSPGNLRT